MKLSLALSTVLVFIAATQANASVSFCDLFAPADSYVALGDNDFLITAAPANRAQVLAAIECRIDAAFRSGLCDYLAGACESEAQAWRFLTTVGVIVNDDGSGHPLFTTFGGRAVDCNSILAKFTYVGDANLDGIVNSADYARIDNAFGFLHGGWANGDFTYDGKVDGNDYGMIDTGFNFQHGALQALDAQAVPEPAPIFMFALLSAAMVVQIYRRQGRAGRIPTGATVIG